MIRLIPLKTQTGRRAGCEHMNLPRGVNNDDH
jgi:hypothetical protein